MEALSGTPSEETVQEYVDIFQKIDWKTGLTGLGILVFGLVAVRLILRLVEKALKASRVPPTLHTMIRTLLRILLDLVVFLSAANAIGIPITSFITLLGLAGLAVSLALQGILGNLVGGFIILASHPFEVGHFIEHDGVLGTVREIRTLHTRIETPDGRMVYIPNSSLSGARIINFSETGKRRVEIGVSASYRNSPDQVRAAVLDAAGRTEGVLSSPAPVVFLDSYGSSDIRYVLWVWVESANFLSVKQALSERMYAAFAAHNVEMTYPHLNVHMKQN